MTCIIIEGFDFVNVMTETDLTILVIRLSSLKFTIEIQFDFKIQLSFSVFARKP